MSYDSERLKYRPDKIKFLLIAESPPPAPGVQSSRQFYYSDRLPQDDRLFINTIRALYPEALKQSEDQLEQDKQSWLKRFQSDGYYMIEALDESQPHEVTKQQRQEKIRRNLPRLIAKVHQLAAPGTKIILIKSNVYEVAAEPLRDAGFNVLNTELVDYPGRYNQKAFREKLAKLSGK